MPVLMTGYLGNAMDGQDSLAPGMEITAKPIELDGLSERVQAMLGHAGGD